MQGKLTVLQQRFKKKKRLQFGDTSTVIKKKHRSANHFKRKFIYQNTKNDITFYIEDQQRWSLTILFYDTEQYIVGSRKGFRLKFTSRFPIKYDISIDDTDLGITRNKFPRTLINNQLVTKTNFKALVLNSIAYSQSIWIISKTFENFRDITCYLTQNHRKFDLFRELILLEYPASALPEACLHRFHTTGK